MKIIPTEETSIDNSIFEDALNLDIQNLVGDLDSPEFTDVEDLEIINNDTDISEEDFLNKVSIEDL